MSENAIHPLEAVLRLVAQVAPQPWFPRQHAEKVGFPVDQLNYYVEHLWLDGLLKKGGEPGGVLLSEAGEAVLRDPEALQRLRDGEALRPGDRGGVVRAVLRQSPRAVVTRWLFWANLLVFGWGLYLAHTRHQAASAYLDSFASPTNAAAVQKMVAVGKVRQQTGSVSADELIRGEWWRLLTNCFVHFGFIHLAFNMYALFAIGRASEQMWGRWRHLTIYLLSGFFGACVAIAFGPGSESGQPPVFRFTQLAGASGALCGLMGGELVWLLLNARYLPRRVVRGWGRGIVINLVLLVVVSLMPGVSALAHFGGMAVGAVAAVLLNVQRFAPAPWRWITLVPLAALPWAGYQTIQWQRGVNRNWQLAEERVLYDDFETRLIDADRAYREAKDASADLGAKKRLALVVRARELYEALQRDLGRPGLFRSKEVLQTRQQILDGIEKLLTKLKDTEEALRPLAEKDAARNADAEKERQKGEAERRTEQEAFDKTFRQRVTDSTAAAEKVLDETVKPLLALAPAKRDPAAVEAARKAMAEPRAALGRLAGELKDAGEYHARPVEEKRILGMDYVTALDRLLGLSESRLRAGDAWGEEDQAKWKRQDVTVEQRRNDWNERVEKK
jgi:membrane associated rhomboid family serine protease